MAAGVDVYTISIVGMVRAAHGMHVQVLDGHVLATVQEYAPVRRICNLYAIKTDIAGLNEIQHLSRTPRDADRPRVFCERPSLAVRPKKERRRVALDAALSAHRHVRLLDTEDEMRAGHTLHATRGILRAHVPVVVVGAVCARLKYSPLRNMQIDVALQEHRPDPVLALWNLDRSSAG